jgi:hypothetical protein
VQTYFAVSTAAAEYSSVALHIASQYNTCSLNCDVAVHTVVYTDEDAVAAASEAAAAAASNEEVAVEKKGKGKKTKLVAKTGGKTVHQYDIMKVSSATYYYVKRVFL